MSTDETLDLSKVIGELEALNGQRDELTRREAVIESKASQLQLELEEVTNLMQQANTSPEQIEGHIKQEKESFSRRTSAYKSALSEYQNAIEAAEAALN